MPYLKPFTPLFAVGLTLSAAHFACAAPADKEEQRISNVVASDSDVIPLSAATRLATVIVLPDQEKAMGVLVGDKTYWTVDVIPGAERFITIKPSKSGVKTDMHILTDHNHVYTLSASEVGSSGPVDVKMFIRPADESTLNKPPTLVSAAEAERLKREVADAHAEAQEARKEAESKFKEKEQAFRQDYPSTLKFAYRFERGKDPFNVAEVWSDQRFTYIKAFPAEQPSLYEIKDGKPNLIEYQVKENGTLYVIPKMLDNSYLQIGKKKLEIWREAKG